MLFLIIFSDLVLIALLAYLLYALHLRVEKLSENQAIMLGWFDTIQKNEETIIKDFSKLHHEFISLEKEVKTGRVIAKAKDAV